MPPTHEDTDHDILLQLKWDVNQINVRMIEALQQLARGNVRFEHIALKEQETSIQLSSLRNDFSRSVLQADGAMVKANDATALAKMISKDLNDFRSNFDDFVNLQEERNKKLVELSASFNTLRAYAKVIGIIFGAIQLIVLPLAIEALKQYLFH